MSQFKCLQSFFLPLSLRLKDTDTREEAVNVGLQGRYGRGAAPWPPPPSSSSSLLHSFVSSSLISRGDPRVCSRSWLTSQAFCWAFSTADTHARRLERKQTHASYNSCIRQEKGSLFLCDVRVFHTSVYSGTQHCGKTAGFPHKHSCPASPAGHDILAPSSQNLRRWQQPVEKRCCTIILSSIPRYAVSQLNSIMTHLRH